MPDKENDEARSINPRDLKEVQDFKVHMLTDKKSEKTIKNYIHMVCKMLEWTDKDPRKITPKDLEHYKTYMALDRNYSKNTLYVHIKAIQAFYRFLEMDVAEEITPPKRSKSLPKYLSKEDMAKLFKAARTDDVNGIRDYAILAVLGYTGLRVSELCKLNTEDLDFIEMTIKVRGGKGDKDRIVIFEEKTAEAIKEHLENRDRHIAKKDSSAIFVSAKKERMTPRTVEKIVKKYKDKAGIQKEVTPHILRHTMATTLLKRGADIRIIQQLLGHSSIATTEIYTHVDEEMLKKAYNKAKPKYDD